MKKTIQKMVVLFLCAAMCLSVLPLTAYADNDAGSSGDLYAEMTEIVDGVTRSQWIQQLVVAFSMEVEEDNYPDNYFSDIDDSMDFYRDIMVATEFGVIDIEAGQPFCPDDPATREFAAHTLNYCLGFQLDDNAAYTFAEAEDVSYPDDIQVAIDKGWFALSDGCFLPNGP